MLTREDNELLTRTDPGTGMGEFFRRFWQPVALSRELAEPDCPPIRVTVMGEELVAFRDTRGRVGLVDARCPHRGAHLFYGRNEECGLRCVYHGWKFDVQGRAVDLPNVPPGARYHDEMRIKAYPTQEFGDLVWAYMGSLSRETVPALPELEFALLPPSHRYVTKKLQECNWAQTIEGGLDTSHFSFLHMPAPSVPSNENPDAPADARRLRWIRNDPTPQFHLHQHEAGFVIGGARAADGEGTYWRITQYMMPAYGTGPSTLPGETYFGYTLVPITDECCWMYTYAWNPDREIDAAEREKFDAGHGIISEVDAQFVPLRNKANDYMLDRHAQKHVSYSGVRGLAEQDAMIQESQGLIVDRTREHLTATDAAVVRFRRVMLDGAKALAAGEEPAAPWSPHAYRNRPGSWIAADMTAFEDVMIERFGDPLGRVSMPDHD
ncbi:MAG: Rieske 2Fe-2S domain-containing protein [Pseudomonadota bacterium]